MHLVTITDHSSLAPMDIIFISDLRLEILIGVYNWERRVPQTVQLDLEIGIPDTGRPRTDRIGETIDYSKVVARIGSFARKTITSCWWSGSPSTSRSIVMSEFRSPWVKVSVTKLAAIKGVKRLGVTIERGQEDT